MPHALGERREVGRRDRPGGEERDTPSASREDAVGDAGVQVHVAVQGEAEVVEEGDGAEPRLSRRRRVLGVRHADRLTEESLDLAEEDRGEGRDGLGAVGKEPAQLLGDGDDPLPDGHGRDDAVHEVGRGLRHAAAAARGTDAAASWPAASGVR